MKYLNYKGASDSWHFEFYNKEKGENVKFKLTEVVIKDVCYTVKGWDEASNSAIYSNDIKQFADEELTVRSKGGELVKGIYRDIKEDILSAGGKLHIKVIGIQAWEEIVITLKGLNFFQLSEVLKDLDKATTKLKFKGTEDDKKGSVKFKKTVFEAGSTIKEGEGDVAELADESNIPF